MNIYFKSGLSIITMYVTLFAVQKNYPATEADSEQ